MKIQINRRLNQPPAAQVALFVYANLTGDMSFGNGNRFRRRASGAAVFHAMLADKRCSDASARPVVAKFNRP